MRFALHGFRLHSREFDSGGLILFAWQQFVWGHLYYHNYRGDNVFARFGVLIGIIALVIYVGTAQVEKKGDCKAAPCPASSIGVKSRLHSKWDSLGHGRVVPNQNNMVPMDAGTMAHIRRGLPRRPISIPAVGITSPQVVRRRTAGVNVLGDLCACTTTNITSQSATLRIGADNPMRLARNRQVLRFGICEYFTHPHSRTQGARRIKPEFRSSGVCFLVGI